MTIEVLQQRGQSQSPDGANPGRLRGGGPLPPPPRPRRGRRWPTEALAHRATRPGRGRRPLVAGPGRDPGPGAAAQRPAPPRIPPRRVRLRRLLQVGPQVRPRPLRPAPGPPVPAGRDPARGPDPERLGRVPPRRPRRPRRADDRLRLRHGPQPQPQGGRRLEPLDGPARLASRPQRGLPPARRRRRGQPDRQPQDGHRAGLRRLGTDQRAISCLRSHDGLSRRCLRGPLRPNRKGRRSAASATARAWTSRAGTSTAWPGSRPGPTRIGRRAPSKRICPATGLSVAASWEAEKPFLRPLPALVARAVRPVKTAPVHKDCTVHFEGRSYVVPFLYAGRDGGGPRLLGTRCRSSIRRPPRC